MFLNCDYPSAYTILFNSKALVGFEKLIKHLDGHQVKIQRNVVTKPGAYAAMPQPTYLTSFPNSNHTTRACVCVCRFRANNSRGGHANSQ